MPPKSRPSFLKRQKEMARLQKQREKIAKRQARKHQREGGGAVEEPADPETTQLAEPPAG